MPTKTRSKVGRPPTPEGRVTLNLTVPPYVKEWLRANGNASAIVRALIDGAIARQKKAQP